MGQNRSFPDVSGKKDHRQPICQDFFLSYFESTNLRSRLVFLQLLRMWFGIYNSIRFKNIHPQFTSKVLFQKVTFNPAPIFRAIRQPFFKLRTPHLHALIPLSLNGHQSMSTHFLARAFSTPELSVGVTLATFLGPDAQANVSALVVSCNSATSLVAQTSA